MFYTYCCINCKKKIEFECKVKDYQPEIKCDCGSIAKRDYSIDKPIGTLVNCSGFYSNTN